MNAPHSVFQVIVDNEKLDILPSYDAAMHRHLQLAIQHREHGARVIKDHEAFLVGAANDHCDPALFAIRYVLCTLKNRCEITIHRLLADVRSKSHVRTVQVDTEFDPSFEILLAAYWVRSGLASLRDERLRIRNLGMTHSRLAAGRKLPEADVIHDLVEVQHRNGGLPLFGQANEDQVNPVQNLGDIMAKWMDKLIS